MMGEGFGRMRCALCGYEPGEAEPEPNYWWEKFYNEVDFHCAKCGYAWSTEREWEGEGEVKKSFWKKRTCYPIDAEGKVLRPAGELEREVAPDFIREIDRWKEFQEWRTARENAREAAARGPETWDVPHAEE